MYINKMIFVENDEAVEEIRKYGFPMLTDYNTYEVMASEVQDRKKELEADITALYPVYPYTLEEFEEDMRNAFGNAYDMLLNNELDFIQVV